MISDEQGIDFDDLPEYVLPHERDMFLWLNEHHTDFWDTFMTVYSGKALWIPLATVLLFCTFYKTKWQNAVLFILCFVLLATLCDQISASIVKPFFSRLRPTHHPDFMNYVLTVDNYRGGRFGFVSSHATNGFGVAVFVSLIYRYRWLTAALLSWALVSCYSRIYLGVHFLSDIMGGIVLGSIIGFLCYLLYQYLRAVILRPRLKELTSPVYKRVHANILLITLGVTVLFNIAYAFVTNYVVK